MLDYSVGNPKINKYNEIKIKMLPHVSNISTARQPQTVFLKINNFSIPYPYIYLYK